jgi:hypothetical protein
LKIILIDDDGNRIESTSFLFANFDNNQNNHTVVHKVDTDRLIDAMNQLYENINNGNNGGTQCKCNACIKNKTQMN